MLNNKDKFDEFYNKMKEYIKIVHESGKYSLTEEQIKINVQLFSIANAYKYYIENDIQKTLEIFNYLTKNDTQRYTMIKPIYEMLGDIYYKQKEYNLAIENYLKVISLFPNRLNTYYNLAKCYYELNDIISTNKYFSLILELCNEKEIIPCFNISCLNKYNCFQRYEMKEAFNFETDRYIFLNSLIIILSFIILILFFLLFILVILILFMRNKIKNQNQIQNDSVLDS
jgi:tetratricopeptide (TPR) repeat protein